MDRLPFLLIGDAPLQTTGLSRIATDLAWRLWDARDALGIDLYQIGQLHWPQLPPTGVPLRFEVPWPVWAYPDTTPNRDAAVGAGIRARYPQLPTHGVLFAVQDPGRSYGLLSDQKGKPISAWARWGYFLVDGVNRAGTIGGPAATAIRRFHEVIAYGPYGQKVLQQIRGAQDVAALPHGIDLPLWQAVQTPEAILRARQRLDPTGSGWPIIGCVATNVARKDLPLFIEVLRQLKADGIKVRGWLHTDREIGEWCVPQLAEDAGLDWKDLTVTLPGLRDVELAEMYRQCALTIAPGRGEGFGYPILESLAVGTPVLHANHGGGADLLAHEDAYTWKIEPVAFHPSGVYAIERPILDAADLALAAKDSFRTFPRPTLTRRRVATFATAYDWATLGPQWDAWFASALDRYRAAQPVAPAPEES